MRRKHRTVLFLLMILSVMVNLAGSVAAEGPKRKITVMVYMCGSNLESRYGSATADIEEMKNANVDPQQVGLLVMTGGSNSDSGYFSSQSNRILEIAGGKVRNKAEETAMNMGEQKTLARFIRYSVESLPAERYALILWNHGGGPLEGTCWDETHGNDHLTLTEIIGAIADGGLDRKLSWIGFDACLMSSLEVAGQLAPYADYMIASQETEPPFGWNYSFLAGLENDADGAETGRRIVDTYFEGNQNTTDILTLACTDLSAAEEAIRAMDSIFAPLSKRMDRDQFLSISGLRMSTTGFGKAAPEVPTTGYDLVDVRDLVSRLEQSEETEAFLALLDRAVVYSRSNEEGANGLTLYHPYANKTGYEDKWKENYEQLAFNKAYQDYVNAFGSMLTGDILFRWIDLIPRTPAVKPDGKCVFELPLTKEQAENMVSAQLLILRDTKRNRLDDTCVLIASCSAELGKDAVLRAEWDGRAIFAETESGIVLGPISYQQTDDGKTNTIIANYYPKNEYLKGSQLVLYELDAADDSEYPSFSRIRVWDEATQSFSSRMTITEEEYRMIEFWNYYRILPTAEEDRILPGFEKWETGSDLTLWMTYRLPDPWHLHRCPLENGQQLYAVFRILDSQQNAVCSLPVEVPNQHLTYLYPVSGQVETEELRADMFCTVNTSSDAFGLQMEWTLKNNTAGRIRIHLDNPILNGTRVTEGRLYSTLEPGQEELITLSLGRYDTLLLNTLKNISGTLVVTRNDEEQEEVPFHFTFDSEDLSLLNRQMDILSEAEADGISLKLLNVEPGLKTGWDLVFLAGNYSGETCSFGDVYLNNIHIGAWFSGELPNETEKVYIVHEDNAMIVDSIWDGMTIAGLNAAGTLIYLETDVLQAMGVRELNNIQVLYRNPHEKKQQIFHLSLKNPVVIGGENRMVRGEAPAEAIVYPPEDLPLPKESALPVLAENNLFQVRLRRFMAGETSIALSLEWTNLSDEWLYISMSLPEGKEKTDIKLSPSSTTISLGTFSIESSGSSDRAFRDVMFFFYDKDRSSEKDAVSAILTSLETISMGREGGMWINGEDFNTALACLPEVNPEQEKKPMTLNETILLPENPEAYRTVMEVPMDSKAEEEIKFYRIAVIRKSSDDYWQIISLYDVKPDGSEVPKISDPGLLQTIAGHPEIMLRTAFGMSDSDILAGKIQEPMFFYTKDGKILECSSIRWELDWNTGKASIKEVKQDPIPCTRQWEIVSEKNLFPIVIKIEPKSDGTLPAIGDCEIQTEPKLSTNVRLNNKPLQLELRPITAEDDLYVMVTVFGKNGTNWSLPVFPYPVSNHASQ